MYFFIVESSTMLLYIYIVIVESFTVLLYIYIIIIENSTDRMYIYNKVVESSTMKMYRIFSIYSPQSDLPDTGNTHGRPEAGLSRTRTSAS